MALPDTRFHMNFAEVIPDFLGSTEATDRITALPAYKASKFAFITPDNCLVELRRRMLAEALPIWQRVHADIDQSLGSLDAGALRKGLRGLAG